MDIPKYLYHATYRPLLKSIWKDGLIPGGQDFRNFDWAGKFVYLAQAPGNAESFVEVSENDDIPEDWLDEVVVLQIDTAGIKPELLAPDSNWNPSVTPEDTNWQSYQYNGIIPKTYISIFRDWGVQTDKPRQGRKAATAV